MSDLPNPPRGGVAGLWLLFCAVAGGAGLAFDVVLHPGRGFWIGAEPGARAAIGALVAVFAIASAHLVRLVLSRRASDDGKGGRDAGDHA
jgi:hypothetical protein